MALAQEEVLKAFKKTIDGFIFSGAPMVFGRLEGMREVVETLARHDASWTEVDHEMERLVKANYEAMAAHTR